jgi:hypothetical protein
MEFIPELTGEIFDHVCNKIQVEVRMIYIVGADSRQLAHMTHFIHHVWPDVQLLLFNSFADVEYIQTGADYKFYIGNLGSIDGDIAYEWYKGEYHRSSSEVFEEKLRDKIINDVTYLADRTKQSYNPSHTLDTITKTLSVSIPEIFIMKEDINVMEILAGASETISRSNMLYLMLIVNIGRRDYYHLTPDKLIRLILDMFHQFRLLKVYNERDEYYHYLFGKSV